MIDLVTAIRSVRAEMNIPAQIPLVLAGASAETKARAERWAEFVQRLARVADISVRRCAAAGLGAAAGARRGRRLPLKGVIDFAAERARLDKEMAKVEADIKRVDAKLGNADFLAARPRRWSRASARSATRRKAAARKIVEALERLKGAA